MDCYTWECMQSFAIFAMQSFLQSFQVSNSILHSKSKGAVKVGTWFSDKIYPEFKTTRDALKTQQSAVTTEFDTFKLTS